MLLLLGGFIEELLGYFSEKERLDQEDKSCDMVITLLFSAAPKVNDGVSV